MPDETPFEQTRTDFPVQQKPVGPLAFSLKGATNSQRFELLGDTPLVVGRALTEEGVDLLGHRRLVEFQIFGPEPAPGGVVGLFERADGQRHWRAPVSCQR